MTGQQLMPAAFLGHGNPMNTLEDNRYTRAWREFGEACGRPRGVVMVSAHWYTNATAVTAMERPRTIHDFYGFPRELSEFSYPAPGSPRLAQQVAEAVLPERIGIDAGSWGLDHGAWSVLAHVFPSADVPVVQLSINALKPLAYHLEMGRRLAALRAQGIVIIGSGNIVHNLGAVRWDAPDGAFDWAQRFDERARVALTEGPEAIAELQADADYPLAAPTPDHFLPLVYVAGLAAESGCAATTLIEGHAYGSVSMTCYTLGAPKPDASERLPAEHQSSLPHPETVSPEQSNL